MKRTFLIFAAILAAISMSAANYDLYVGGVRVTDSNKDNITGSYIKAFNTSKSCKVTYDSNTKTLTLTNVSIVRTGSGNRAIQNSGIDGLTIVFDGQCNLSAKDQGTIKLDKNTTIKSGRGREDLTTFIRGINKDGLCVFNGATCTIDDARLSIDATNSDAIWGDTQKENLIITNSSVIILGMASSSRAIYNFNSVSFSDSYIHLGASQAIYCMQKVNSFTLNSNMKYRNGVEASLVKLNGMGVLSVTKGTYSSDQGIVMESYVAKVDASYFPDPKFRQFIEDQGYDDNGYLFNSNLREVTDMGANNLEISDLTGIEYFRWLKYLHCTNNKLTSLDLSKNTELFHLSCSNNQLTSLDLPGKNLNDLDCSNNELKTLDLTNNRQLTVLKCNDNQLTELELNCKEKLSYLYCYNNQLSSLDLTDYTELRIITANNNRLTSLLIDGCSNFTQIQCVGNRLNGSAMTKLINGLRTRDGSLAYLVNHADENEENEFTAADAQIAKGRGWTLMHRPQSASGYSASSECVSQDLWVSGKRICSCNNSRSNSVNYYKDTKTLTLEDADIKGQDISGTQPYGCAIYSRIADLTIDVKGENFATASTPTGSSNNGIYLAGATTIKGGGKLTAYGNSGIYSAFGDLTVKDSVIILAAGGQHGLYGNGVLTLQDNVHLIASNENAYVGGPIYNWTDLRLRDGLAIIEPEGIAYRDRALRDSRGNVLRDAAVLIGQPDPHLLGDVNEDGEINTSDVVAIYNYIIDGDASGINRDYADVDADGEVSTSDIVAVYNIIINGN